MAHLVRHLRHLARGEGAGVRRAHVLRHRLAAAVQPALFNQPLDRRLADHGRVIGNGDGAVQKVRLGAVNSWLAAQERIEGGGRTAPEEAARFEHDLAQVVSVMGRCWPGGHDRSCSAKKSFLIPRAALVFAIEAAPSRSIPMSARMQSIVSGITIASLCTWKVR